MAITLFGPATEVHLFEKWFLASFPKFAGLHPGDELVTQSLDGLQVLQKASVSCLITFTSFAYKNGFRLLRLPYKLCILAPKILLVTLGFPLQ